MLDWEPSEMEEPSEAESGGVSPPELEVHVLDLDRAAGPGRVKTGTAWKELLRSSPSAMRQLSSRL